MNRQRGFTVIELVSALVLTVAVAALALNAKNNIDASARDQDRKTAVNAIYYGLKEGYYPKNKAYPTSLSPETLPYIDPQSFKRIGDDKKYQLRYRGINCTDTACQGFRIENNLEKEATYKKQS